MSSLYNNARSLFASGEIRWKSGGDNIRVFLVDNAYTPNLDTDKFLSDIPAGSRWGNNGGNLTSDAILLTLVDPIDGHCSCGNITFTAPPAGNTIASLIVFKDSGNDSTSELICVVNSSIGLPFLTNGGDIEIQWNANGIFRI